MAVGSLVQFLIVNLALLVHLPKLSCDEKSGNYRLQVRPERLCLKPDTKTDTSCWLSFKGNRSSTRAFENWTLVWYHDGETLSSTAKFDLESRALINRVKVYRSGRYTCIGRHQSLARVSKNRSMIVETAPAPVKEILGKPIYTADENDHGSHVVQVNWRSGEDSDKYTYQLVYWWHGEEHNLSQSNDVKCKGSMCRGSFGTDMNDFTNVSFYISSSFAQCEVRSPTWTFYLASFAFTTEPSQVVFTPPSPNYLYITTRYRRVTLKWQDDMDGLGNVSYRCSSSSEKVMELEARTVELNDEDIKPYQPYDECTFCVRVQWYVGGRYSYPRCNTTRLSEESPSKAPMITCTGNTCPTSDDGHKRNVTISWRLPPRQSWNGVLTKLKVIYRSTLITSRQMELSVRNLTSNSSVIPGLNSSQSYIVTMQACTKEGCSKDGNNLEILASKGKSTSSSTIIIIVVVVSSIGVVVVAIALFTLVKKIPPAPSFLPILREPEDHEYCAFRDNSEIFDHLDKDLIQKDTNSNETYI